MKNAIIALGLLFITSAHAGELSRATGTVNSIYCSGKEVASVADEACDQFAVLNLATGGGFGHVLIVKLPANSGIENFMMGSKVSVVFRGATIEALKVIKP